MAPIGNRADWSESAGVDRAVADVEATSRVVAGPGDLDDLVDRLGDSRYVLLGEASHGTSEFYRWRARLTARLIVEHDFDFVAVEGDWTSCETVNRFVTDRPEAPGTVRETVDAFVHVDSTEALHPIALRMERERVPELYPSGL